MATLQAPEGKSGDDQPGQGTPRFQPLRFRALLLGFLLVIPVSYACTNQSVSGIFSLMTAPMSALLLTILANFFLRKISPKLALTQTDLIVIFCICSVGGAVSGEWSTFQYASNYHYPYFAKWNGTYKDYLMKYIPDWLVIKDMEKVKDIQGGGKDIWYTFSRLNIYFPIWCAWAGLIVTLCFAMMCINSLMRGAWCERERLTFPLIQLPVAMCEDGGAGAMWKSKFMWIAFAIMFGIDILNGLNYLYPNVPAIPVKDLFYINNAFKEPPLSNIGDFRISIYPFMAAIGLFVPSDLLFSIVVFFLMRKGLHVLLAANGIPQSTFSGTAIAPGPPYFDEQTWGAVIAMFLGAMWVSKDYLREIWSDIKTGRGAEDGGFKHRWAFVGLIVAFGVMVAYGVAGKLPLPYMVAFVALFLIFSIVLTRLRAQLGPPTHEFAFFGSSSIMHRFLGTKWISDEQASYVSQVFLVMNRIYRNHPMPYQLEAMKMGKDERLHQGKLFGTILAATVFAFFVGQFFLQVKVFRTGDLGWSDAPTYLENLLRDRKGPDILGIVMTIVGFAIVMVLDAIRFRFPGFPLHPAGYMLSMNFGVDYYWFGILMALLVKNFVQKNYGLPGYDKLRQVAFGILVGEYAAETIWMAMALITHQSTYTISFNDRSLLGQ